MIAKVHPQAVLVYTNTYDHRRVVEVCARHGVHVMMEKPLAVSLEDALAIESAREGGKDSVLVNYETSWYRKQCRRPTIWCTTGRSAKSARWWCTMATRAERDWREPEFLAWLTDPKTERRGRAVRFRMLRCGPDDVADGRRASRSGHSGDAADQAANYSRVDDEATMS